MLRSKEVICNDLRGLVKRIEREGPKNVLLGEIANYMERLVNSETQHLKEIIDQQNDSRLLNSNRDVNPTIGHGIAIDEVLED